MPTPTRRDAASRRQRIIAGLQGRNLEDAAVEPALRADLEAEAASADPDKLVTPDLLEVVDQARAARHRGPEMGLFVSTDDVVIVPGFLGSELVDQTGPDGLIWIDPKLVFDTHELLDLGLKPHCLSDVLIDNMIGRIVKCKDRIKQEVILPRIKWDADTQEVEELKLMWAGS